MSETDVSDGHHGFDSTPAVLYARIPARVTMLQGYELIRAQQVDPRATHGVLIRYRQGVASGQTVIHHDAPAGDRSFEVVGPPMEPEDRHRDLQLLCREQKAAA